MELALNPTLPRRAALAHLAGLTAGAATLASPWARALAQGPLPDGWPNKPVRLIIPSGAGAQTDLFARFIGEHLRKTFGQLTAEEKASVSHRGKALRAFAAALDDYLKGNE